MVSTIQYDLNLIVSCHVSCQSHKPTKQKIHILTTHHRITSHYITSHHNTSHHITSHHIYACHVTACLAPGQQQVQGLAEAAAALRQTSLLPVPMTPHHPRSPPPSPLPVGGGASPHDSPRVPKPTVHRDPHDYGNNNPHRGSRSHGSRSNGSNSGNSGRSGRGQNQNKAPSVFDFKYLLIEVKDTGAGISPENIEKLFGQYVQFNAGALQNGGGSGLGLWISKGIIDMHGTCLAICYLSTNLLPIFL